MRRVRSVVLALLGLCAGCGRLGFDGVGRDADTGDASDGALSDEGPRVEITEQFVPSNADNHVYGTSVAVSGDGLRYVVGAPGVDGDRGNAQVWRYDPGVGWSAEGSFLAANNADQGDLFGYAVAIDGAGTRIVISAPTEDSVNAASPEDNTLLESGAAYVFERTGTDWVQVAFLKASNADAGDYFGHSVAISADGSTIAVGANEEDGGSTGLDGNMNDDTQFDAGAAYTFVRGATAWTPARYVKASNTRSDQWFGDTVGLSADGTVLAVGATHESSNATGVDGDQTDVSLPLAGAVYVIDLTTGDTAYVKASNTSTGDFFGASLSLSGDGRRLLVGAPGEDSGSTNINGTQDEAIQGSGAAYLFERPLDTWEQVAFVKASNTGPNDELGKCVGLSTDGNSAVVGAFREDGSSAGRDGPDDDALSDSGAVYQFTRSAAGWAPAGYLKATDPAMDDQFGSACAISGDGYGIAVGAPQRGNAVGSLYVFLSIPE